MPETESKVGKLANAMLVFGVLLGALIGVALMIIAGVTVGLASFL